ncbi:MAG: low molecular weight phosphatase family protein [Haloferacaceae archaeon]
MIRLAFVCVRNAGRSQMAAAFAERERDRRGLGDEVEILTGGTRPADAVHEGVVAAMDEVGIDLSDRVPREITTAELEACDRVATMGCSTLDLDADADTDVRDWALDDPGGRNIERVREIRDGIADRVAALFDEIDRDLDAEVASGR